LQNRLYTAHCTNVSISTSCVKRLVSHQHVLYSYAVVSQMTAGTQNKIYPKGESTKENLTAYYDV